MLPILGALIGMAMGIGGAGGGSLSSSSAAPIVLTATASAAGLEALASFSAVRWGLAIGLAIICIPVAALSRYFSPWITTIVHEVGFAVAMLGAIWAAGLPQASGSWTSRRNGSLAKLGAFGALAGVCSGLFRR